MLFLVKSLSSAENFSCVHVEFILDFQANKQILINLLVLCHHQQAVHYTIIFCSNFLFDLLYHKKETESTVFNYLVFYFAWCYIIALFLL